MYEMQAMAKRLAQCNARFLGQKTFLDTWMGLKCIMRRYYDFADHKLALRNIWLRQRQSTWELKSGNIPKVDPDHLNGLGTTHYVYRLSQEGGL